MSADGTNEAAILFSRMRNCGVQKSRIEEVVVINWGAERRVFYYNGWRNASRRFFV